MYIIDDYMSIIRVCACNLHWPAWSTCWHFIENRLYIFIYIHQKCFILCTSYPYFYFWGCEIVQCIFLEINLVFYISVFHNTLYYWSMYILLISLVAFVHTECHLVAPWYTAMRKMTVFLLFKLHACLSK